MMVAYTTPPGDVEMALEERTVVLVEKKSSTGWMWKLFGALLIVALCFGGVLLFAWYWNGRPEMKILSGQKEAHTTMDTSENTDHHDALKRIGSNAKAAIHLEGSYDEDDRTNQVEWKNGQGQAFAQGGFRLESNKIVIPQNGLFFVYSQASFRVSCNDGDEDRGAGKRLTPLSHRIWRYSDSIGSNVSLMSAVRSACQNTAQEDGSSSGQGWYNAVYLGAVFQLNQGDRLWTETNQLSELETDEGKTFFGVFAL
ncbi:tumor necrosis factor b (TNF superfamily, member 2) [Notolabrus celidotus]|uniref:tumor necrosis factor b (TNF superfamily, member 2) n=1 Tax=Notolabrus celidotus TaxID=1203425 RepID=UPI00148FC422|nr:tumor necrosis factor b (TNF superfamily, member 2) [Notolabrus celidotus]